MLANRGAPRGRILKSSVAAPTQSQQIVPQGPAVIESFARAKDGFYLSVMDGGIYRLKRMTRTGSVTEFALPFDGTIGAIYANPDEDGALLSYGGWLEANRRLEDRQGWRFHRHAADAHAEDQCRRV